ncbi:hypothetical protein G6L94_25370 [Agrobacterium rhizogenes]|nr:hypothetical protein CN09_33230 [Rhizobium rhizogenes]OCJ04783.1 hypothetical protein A6U85_25630 [Agrobacterium sp. 13-626]OCJ23494.1 hypothetical protein A6U88_27770 [Agrobacterium sp. B131/95]OCJ29053.1 hypothetical protein A6U89_27620 [Agrobacterium sp. B133/95]MQB35068.1 hypothetical protein [Rhizobium rhizogenes]
MRQTHDVVGGALKTMNDLADNLTTLITASYPPAVILTTLMSEAALAFPGLRDADIAKLIDDLLQTAKGKSAASAEVIPFPLSRRREAATVLASA